MRWVAFVTIARAVEKHVPILIKVLNYEADLVVVAGQEHVSLPGADGPDDVSDHVDAHGVAVHAEELDDLLPALLLEARDGGAPHHVAKNAEHVNRHSDHWKERAQPVKDLGNGRRTKRRSAQLFSCRHRR